jgi:NAD-dependent deacetylase
MIDLAPTDSIVILTGAGISKESGLDTFRDAGGAWARYSMEDVCTPDGFRRNPALLHEFYNGRRRALAEVEPNAAHRALARLEAEWTGPVLLVTQNVDDLHERGGSVRPLHMHGELRRGFCVHCDHHFEVSGDLSAGDVCPACKRPGGLRPDIVFFGEVPYEMERIAVALDDCALFLSIGTSGHVYPAAGFVAEAVSAGAYTVELNLEPSLGASMFDRTIHGPATDVVPAFVDALLRGQA